MGDMKSNVKSIRCATKFPLLLVRIKLYYQYLGNMAGGVGLPFERFQVGFNGFGNVRPSVVMLGSNASIAFDTVPHSDGFVRFQQLIKNNISVFDGFWPSFTRTVVNIEIRHFHTTKSIWRQNKVTNVSKRFVYHMFKLGSWRFGYVGIEQHLLLEPFIHQQRELSCAPK